MKTSFFALEFANRDTWRAGVSPEARSGYSTLHAFKEYGGKFAVGIGLIDVHRDDVESAELVRDRIAYAAKIIGDPSRVMASPDCGLRTRSREISFAKLRSLVEGARLARRELG
jgi:5-methyltetrahydropteroyltriglutamate--homocysteine methyltransferase